MVGGEEQKVTGTSGKDTAGSTPGGFPLFTQLAVAKPVLAVTWAGSVSPAPVRVLLCPSQHSNATVPLLVPSSLKVCPALSESWKGD